MTNASQPTSVERVIPRKSKVATNAELYPNAQNTLVKRKLSFYGKNLFPRDFRKECISVEQKARRSLFILGPQKFDP